MAKYDVSKIKNDIEAVKYIEQRRLLLQRVSNLVNAVQKLTSSLNVLWVSTGSNAVIADKTFGLLDYLDDKQKNLSTAKIEIRLEALDNSVRDQLSKILVAVRDAKGLVVTDFDLDEEGLNPLDEVSEFRRKVRLSMAYRLLITERGVEVEPINLDVAPELISNCMKHLEQQEGFYKDKLLNDMTEFHSELQLLTKNKGLSTRLLGALKTASQQIKDGVAAIRLNKPIEVLPEVLDVSDFLDVKDADGQAIVHEDEPTVEVSLDAKDEKAGFFSTLNKWLSTPANVSWEESKKKNK